MIRKSRHDTVTGKPNNLYYLPERNGGVPNLILPVLDEKLQYVRSRLTERCGSSNYQEYFDYVMDTCELSRPNNWREGLVIYDTLTDHALDGFKILST